MKKLKGSYTVEAAMIFPLIMTVIVIIMYLAFFIHDRCVLYTSAYEAALRASMVRTSDADRTAVAESAAESLKNQGLLRTEQIEKEVVVNGDNITVKMSGKFSIPGNIVFMGIGGTSGITVDATATAMKKDPVLFIRKCRFIENITE